MLIDTLKYVDFMKYSDMVQLVSSQNLRVSKTKTFKDIFYYLKFLKPNVILLKTF